MHNDYMQTHAAYMYIPYMHYTNSYLLKAHVQGWTTCLHTDKPIL